MGDSPRSSLVSFDFSGKKQCCNRSSDSLWSKDPKSQAKKRKTVRAAPLQILKNKRSRRALGRMRGACIEVSRRPREGMQSKVRTLKKLVPNTKAMGLDGLFRETADYILCLQMKVKVMQAMFNLLSAGSEED
ncbi:hypothetical protein LguiA_011297 [Lonicera macranthoides]